MNFETLNVNREEAVLFAEIAAPPMNLLGPDLVRDLVFLIQQAEADAGIRVLVFKSADPDYVISHVDVTRIKEYRAEAWLASPSHPALMTRQHWLIDRLFSTTPGMVHTLLNPGFFADVYLEVLKSEELDVSESSFSSC